jgi:hypothetical protein
MIFCPIDYFHKLEEIKKQSHILCQCDLILSHSQRLVSHFAQYTKTYYVDHHLKFVLPKIASYKKTGPIIWTGHSDNIPYLLHFLTKCQLPTTIQILTDADPSKNDANKQLLGQASKLNKIEIQQWTPRRQLEALAKARAAIDIKGNTFNQNHKPPTKLQMYVASGVPIACNTSCESYQYGLEQGLPVATPNEIDRWFSKEYYDQTVELAKRLRIELSQGVICSKYRQYFESLVNQPFVATFDSQKQLPRKKIVDQRAIDYRKKMAIKKPEPSHNQSPNDKMSKK